MKKIVLLRHGESEWNKENRFTGWTDVDLTPQGIEEAREAARLLKSEGLSFDRAYTSFLTRAVHTLNVVLAEMRLDWIAVRKSWRLNEKHYGALQGLNKKETNARHDRRYATVPDGELPRTESLRDTIARALPYWECEILPALAWCDSILVVAHGNSLRGIVKQLKGISDSDIAGLELPTAAPWVFEFDDGMRLVHDYMPGNPDELARRMAAVAAQGRN